MIAAVASRWRDWTARIAPRLRLRRTGASSGGEARRAVGTYLPAPRGPVATAAVYVMVAAIGVVLGTYIALMPQTFIGYLIGPIAVLGLFAVWMFPETGRPPTRVLGVAFVAYTVLMILWPYYLAVRLQGLPLIEVRRVAILIALLAFFISLSVSVRFRSTMGDIVAYAPWFFRVLAVFVGLQIASTILGRDINASVPDMIKNLIGWTGALFVATWIALNPQWTERWRLAVIWAAVGLIVIGLLEARNEGVLWANSIPSFLAINEPAVYRTLNPVFRAGEYRVVGTFSVSLSLAEFLFLSMPLFLYVIAFGKRWWLRVAAVVIDILLWTVIIDTQARLGMVGGIVTHLGFFLLWSYWLRQRNPTNLITTGLVYSFPMIVAATVGAVLSIYRLRVMVLGGGQHQASTDARWAQLDAAKPLMLSHPIFGYGPNQGGPTLNFRNGAGVLTIDSGLLSLALDFGVMGAICFLFLFGWGIVYGIRLAVRRLHEPIGLAGPLAIALIGYLVVRFVLSQNDNMSMAYMYLGMILGLCYLDQKEQAAKVPKVNAPPLPETSPPPLLRRRTQGPRIDP